jgi:hypothetical protein
VSAQSVRKDAKKISHERTRKEYENFYDLFRDFSCPFAAIFLIVYSLALTGQAQDLPLHSFHAPLHFFSRAALGRLVRFLVRQERLDSGVRADALDRHVVDYVVGFGYHLAFRARLRAFVFRVFPAFLLAHRFSFEDLLIRTFLKYQPPRRFAKNPGIVSKSCRKYPEKHRGSPTRAGSNTRCFRSNASCFS